MSSGSTVFPVIVAALALGLEAGIASAGPPVPVVMPPAPAVTVEDLGGEGWLEKIGPKSREKLAPGGKLQPLDHLKTGFRSSAKIRYADGSKLLIGRDTEITVLFTPDGKPLVQLDQGQLRTSVPKPVEKTTPKSPHRFLIRTRTAVMGVRGTDFVTEFDPATARTEVHTLSGTVDLAKDEKLLRAGRSTYVVQNRYARADAREVSRALNFEPKAFMSAFETKQPDLLRFASADRLAFLEEYELENRPSSLSFLAFRLGGVLVAQQSGDSTFSPFLSWNPSFRLASILAVTGHLEAFLLKDSVHSSTITAVEAGGLLTLTAFGFLEFEAGGGLETWTGGNGTTGVVWLGDVAARLRTRGPIQRVVVGLSYFPNSPSGSTTDSNPATQLQAGVGFAF